MDIERLIVLFVKYWRKNMQIKNIKVGPLETNCYILTNGNGCIVIDPGDDYEKIVEQIGNQAVEFILVTHYHEDHIGALNLLSKNYRAKIYDRNNLEEKRYQIGDYHFEVIYTPGHKSDSISIYFYEYHFMFTGDFLFKGTIGRTDLETGNPREMEESLIKISKYPDTIKIYPGHGDFSTLAEEKRTNYYLKKYNE